MSYALESKRRVNFGGMLHTCIRGPVSASTKTMMCFGSKFSTNTMSKTRIMVTKNVPRTCWPKSELWWTEKSGSLTRLSNKLRGLMVKMMKIWWRGLKFCIKTSRGYSLLTKNLGLFWKKNTNGKISIRHKQKEIKDDQQKKNPRVLEMMFFHVHLTKNESLKVNDLQTHPPFSGSQKMFHEMMQQ